MEEREITCINCPVGCLLDVAIEDGEVVSVAGNTCPRGAIYAQKEAGAPRRTVTGTVALAGGSEEVIAAKTVPDVPKESLFEVAQAMDTVLAHAPIHVGDVIVKDIAGTGSQLVATRSVE